MAISCEISTRGDLMEVVASGFDRDLEDVQAYGLAVIQAAIQTGSRKILCNEVDLEYRLGTLDTFASAEFMSAQAPGVARAAIVCHPRHLANAQFWETVAVNRGLTIRVFLDLDEATAWLEAP